MNGLGLLFIGLLRDKAVTGLGLSGFPVREVRRRMEGSPAEGFEVGDVALIGGDLLDPVSRRLHLWFGGSPESGYSRPCHASHTVAP